MKYYLIAGEASGDLHGSNLIKELKKLDKEAVIRCWGGELMQEAGADLVKHYKDLAFMGFIEVVKNLRTIFSNLAFCKRDIENFAPDVLVLIDYPGFNLRIAKWAKQHDFRVIYYISPQVWAWKENRVKGIKKWVDKMLVILPFEKDFYKKWNYEAVYVGHPLLQVIKEFSEETAGHTVLKINGNNLSANKTDKGIAVVALLPGSRKQEIVVKLPIMLEASTKFPNYRFVIAQAPSLPYEMYKEMIFNYPNVEVASPGQTYALLKQAQAALVTSGTATLETALFGVPQVVCYKGSRISYQIAMRLVKIKYIALVNLIMDKPVVKELIQNELTAENLVVELDAILHDKPHVESIQNYYAELKQKLQQAESASTRAAREIVGYLWATS